VADKEGFVLVTPDGTNSPQRWYIYGQLEPGYVDDFAFTNRLLDHLIATLCIDKSRIYATGISNGGGTASLVGCRLNERIAAVAPVAGAPFSNATCRGREPMPVIAFHGTDDELVPFEGGLGGRLNLLVTSVRTNMREWAEHNGCNMTLQSERIAPDVVLESYRACKGGAEVLLYVVEGGGHTWPGSSRNINFLGATTQSIRASELMWGFFEQHTR
jgi:polyhydroxybutyrate depolymerase